MNKSDLRNLIKNTIEEILQEREINVADKKDIPKDLEDDDVVNISKNIKNSQALQQKLSKSDNDKTQSDKLKNIGDRFKSKPVKMTKDFYS
jgi:galactitol-specific phosphotransferase system IIB component